MGGETVVVAGATGYIGQHVVRELVSRNYDVIALSRERSGVGGSQSLDDVRSLLPGARVIATNVMDPASVEVALGDTAVHAIVSCLASRSGEPKDAWAIDYGANRVLLDHAEAAGARYFVLLSAICVQKPALEFQRAKLKLEEELAAAPITHSIVRPTAFFKSLAGQIRRVREGRPFLLLGDGTITACKPISERDLARFMADCLTDPSKHDAVLPVGGPGPAITPRQQGEMLFSLLGREPRYRTVPLWVFNAIIGGSRMASLLWPPLRAKTELAKIGRYYATESMLLWNEDKGAYDAEQTPSFGTDTLEAFYREAVREEDPGAELGDHSVFS